MRRELPVARAGLTRSVKCRTWSSASLRFVALTRRRVFTPAGRHPEPLVEPLIKGVWVPVKATADALRLHDGAVGEPVVDGPFGYGQDASGVFFCDRLVRGCHGGTRLPKWSIGRPRGV